MKRVNRAFRNISKDRIIELDKLPSFSMFSALNDGFHVVLYSRTHKYLPKVLHKSLGLRLVLGNGMNLIFNGHLIHGGGKGRINDEGILSEDKRMFYYIWNTSSRCQKENGRYIYRSHIPMCSSYHYDDNLCHACDNDNQSIFDLSNLDISNMPAGDTIAGNLDYLGWIVVKGVTMCPKVSSALNKYSTTNKWHRIGKDHGASMKFDSNNHTKQYQNWMHDPLLVDYFDMLRTKVITRCLKNDSYVIGYRNIISNKVKTEKDQIPHTDYKVIME